MHVEARTPATGRRRERGRGGAGGEATLGLGDRLLQESAIMRLLLLAFDRTMTSSIYKLKRLKINGLSP